MRGASAPHSTLKQCSCHRQRAKQADSHLRLTTLVRSCHNEPLMIRFSVLDNQIELEEYSDDATLPELAATLEAFRGTCELKTKHCRGCGECCGDDIPVLGFDLPRLMAGTSLTIDELPQSMLVLPEAPSLERREKAIRDLIREHGFSELNATLLYEYNNAEPAILSRNDDGTCRFLKDKLCSFHEHRPYACGLYLCTMAEKLSFVHEMIVRQGTWHLYSVLGWIPREAISHNPFTRASSWDALSVRDFDVDLRSTLDALFFYF